MDSRPFLEFNMLDFDDADAEDLRRFTNAAFDVGGILDVAKGLKYTRHMKHILADEVANPSEELVRLLASRVYPGRMTQPVRDQFTQVVKTAFAQFINERVTDRLKSALERESAPAEVDEPVQNDATEDKGIVTTEEEIEGFQIVKSILRETVDVHRITTRDTKTHCGVLLDDTNRKPICRLRFDGPKLYLGLIDENKSEEQVPIEDLDSIYRYAERLKATVAYYDRQSASGDQA